MMIFHLKRNVKFICLFMSIGLLVGIFYAFMMFVPVYKSAATFMVDTETVLGQVYILKSATFAEKIAEKLNKKYEINGQKWIEKETLRNTIEVYNPKNTNILIISAKWTNPTTARNIADAYLSVYRDLYPEITLLDLPQVPVLNEFPRKLDTIALFVLSFGLIAVLIELFKVILNKQYHLPEEIEHELGVSVLGRIPWLEREIYDEPDIMFAIDESASFYSLAFQKAVSCIKLKGLRTNKRVFAFTSTEFSKSRSTVIMNMAYSLSRTGDSVIVVDADFRTPSIGRDIELKMDNKKDLSGLLKNFSNTADRHTYSISGVDNFFIIPNNGDSGDPSLYLYSSAFKLLIQELKLKYDWVFIDVPPASAVPDAFMVGPSIDGIILITGLEPEKAVLKTLCNDFITYGIDVFGIITRELQNKEAVSANLYIKQMISHMMSQNNSLIAE